jgi:hypothetical protein
MRTTRQRLSQASEGAGAVDVYLTNTSTELGGRDPRGVASMPAREAQ